MNQPKVSVIMSVYNGEKFLSIAIESILNQSYTDFEFIIIDDCSTDESLKIINTYAQQDNRIKIITRDQNIGIKGFIKNLNFLEFPLQRENILLEWIKMTFLRKIVFCGKHLS